MSASARSAWADAAERGPYRPRHGALSTVSVEREADRVFFSAVGPAGQRVTISMARCAATTIAFLLLGSAAAESDESPAAEAHVALDWSST